MNTIKFLLAFCGWFFPKYDFNWVVKVRIIEENVTPISEFNVNIILFILMPQELQSPLELELDFLAEARNAEKCRRDLSHLQYAYVPKVFWDQSSHV